jgi:hypothetical protein
MEEEKLVRSYCNVSPTLLEGVFGLLQRQAGRGAAFLTLPYALPAYRPINATFSVSLAHQ